MLPSYNFYWFRIDNKHMTEPLLDQALMKSANKCGTYTIFVPNCDFHITLDISKQ